MIGKWKERLTDVVSGKFFLFQHQDLVTMFGEEARLAGAGGAGQKVERARLDRKGQVFENFGAIAIAQAHIGKLDQERVLPARPVNSAAQSESISPPS